jgi:predicted O-methyltransferase YrrM
MDTDHAPWAKTDEYISQKLIGEDSVLEAALAKSAAAGLPQIQVTPCQGKLLQLLARLTDAQRILEIGTLGGYSTIWLARALPPDGRLITLEINPHHAEVAASNLSRANLLNRVELRVGPALELLPTVAAEGQGPFDLIFIDADKPNTADYFSWAINLSRPGSLIVVDNVMRKGALIEAENPDPAVQGMRRFMERLAAEPRVTATAIQTVGAKGYDGFALALVTGEGSAKGA